MGFWLYCLGMNLLIPAIMALFGQIFLKRPPKNINAIYGYRTSRSMKNQQTWDFAHQVCGRIWRAGGLILLPLTLAFYLCLLGQPVNRLGVWSIAATIVQLMVLMGTIFPVERALKNTFDDFGRKR